MIGRREGEVTNASREYISTQNANKPQCLISFSIRKYGKICGQRFIKLQVFLYNRRPAKRAATVLKVKSKITIKGKPTTPQRSASQAQTAGQFHLAKGFYNMHRAFTFSITTAFLLFACSLFSPKETPPSETAIAPTTSMPATQPSTSVPATQLSVEQPNLQQGGPISWKPSHPKTGHNCNCCKPSLLKCRWFIRL